MIGRSTFSFGLGCVETGAFLAFGLLRNPRLIMEGYLGDRGRGVATDLNEPTLLIQVKVSNQLYMALVGSLNRNTVCRGTLHVTKYSCRIRGRSNLMYFVIVHAPAEFGLKKIDRVRIGSG